MDQATRDLLRDSARFLGPLMCVVGVIMVFYAMSTLGDAGPYTPGPVREPSLMPAFLGMMLLGAGGFITKWAWIGPVAGYVAEEVAPAVGTTTRAVMQEVRGGAVATAACLKCRTHNAPDAKFCKGCGANMAKTCGACNGGNAADARFCDDCGAPLA